MFYDCGLCGQDHGLAKMMAIDESMKSLIRRSAIPDLYKAMIAPLDDPQADQYEVAYAAEVLRCLDADGLMRGAEHICCMCFKKLPKKPKRASVSGPRGKKRVSFGTFVVKNEEDNNDEADVEDNAQGNKADCYKVPRYAFVNGLFRGETPPELQCLNRTEHSLINLIDIIATITPLPSSEHWNGSHWGGSASVFSVFNDVVKVIQTLPRKPTQDQIMVIRSSNHLNLTDYEYSPWKLMQALEWLERNNHLYKDMVKNLQDAAWVEALESKTTLEVPYIEATEKDFEGLNPKPPQPVETEEAEDVATEQEEQGVLPVVMQHTGRVTRSATEMNKKLKNGKYVAVAVKKKNKKTDKCIVISKPEFFKEQDEADEEDGHAVNPGAPRFQDILLEDTGEAEELVHQIRKVVAEADTAAVVHAAVDGPVPTAEQAFAEAAAALQKDSFDQSEPSERPYMMFASEKMIDFFMQKAFVSLYPYGRGGPERANPHVAIEESYFEHCMYLGGDRSFQKNPSFIFYAYTCLMKKRIGVMSALAKNSSDPTAQPQQENGESSGAPASDGNEADVTVGDMKSVLQLLTSPDPTDQFQEEIAGVSMERIRRLLSRLQPYAFNAPGTEMYFKGERKKLMAMITSPVTTSTGQWRWFYTEAQSDKYLPEIYDNLVTSAPEPCRGNLTQRREASDKLSPSQRAQLLRDHPFMSARIHALQQDAYWQHILMGEDKPLGFIQDYWRRVEFQARGTPHTHNLIAILHRMPDGTKYDEIDESTFASSDIQQKMELKRLLFKSSTARLEKRHKEDISNLNPGETVEQRLERESEYEHNLDKRYFFRDDQHPSRVRFRANEYDFRRMKLYKYKRCQAGLEGEGPDKGEDVRRSDARGEGPETVMWGHNLVPNNEQPVDSKHNKLCVQFRNLQLANQLHRCRQSCYKYWNHVGERKCRYEYDVKEVAANNYGRIKSKLRNPLHTYCQIVKDRDRRNRVRIQGFVPRNNGNLNPCPKNPLQVLTHRGNSDLKLITGQDGAIQYVSKYVSKADQPDCKALQNLIVRKLSSLSRRCVEGESVELQAKLRAVGNAVISCQQIGAVQAAYILGKLPLVKSSRASKVVNPLRRKEFTKHPVLSKDKELEGKPEECTAINHGPKTQYGMRDAYEAFYMHQRELHPDCKVVNYFSFLTSFTPQLDPDNRSENSQKKDYSELLVTDEHGIITNAKTFFLQSVSNISQ